MAERATKPALNRYARQVLTGLIEVMAPYDPDIGIPMEEINANCIAAVERMMGHMPAPLRVMFPLGLFALEWSPIVFMGIAKPFHKITHEQKVRYLQGWQRSAFTLRRELVKGVNALVASAFYSDPRVLDYLGYHPEPFAAEVTRRRNEKHGDPLEGVRDVA